MVFGTPVSGEEFFDRKALLSDLKKTIYHAHHALIGPRGCGKSSVLKQLAEMERVNNLVPIYIDIGRIVPRTYCNVIKKIGREALYAVVKDKGLIKSMPALIRSKVANVADFVRDNFRVKISDWITLYFDPEADLTEFIEQTFSTIESYGTEMLLMLDEISSIVKISGTKPNDEDMEFLEALKGHISDAKNVHYILSGSRTGIMDLLIKVKFGRLLVPKEIGGLEEGGAEELVRNKIGQVSASFITELKKRTHLWPLYIQAYCLATKISKARPEKVADLDNDVFGILHGHFRYLESELSEHELLVLLSSVDDQKVSTIAAKIGASYYAAQSALRTLELKGFVKKIAPGTYLPLDPLFSDWLKREYEKPEEWK